ncbi:Glucokinase [[Actinomadura] parvosata subsp. kistnae]|uniref:Glucokinase n=1 Tax=[Actinomadura] parvosata subsp. kistnae TaxID=1909395 RepID=A0A1U9ZT26_9ACTN|nr:hypothetical protein BKM31_05990 [Nonomuraea sp. ATCC 55076]SPL87530.1 Glucokinase [Actinomadura parvosata subsp. kistnae]
MRLEIVNDMIATVAGVRELTVAECRSLTPGIALSAPSRLVVAVGTGVGVGYADGEGRPHGTEAGHIPWQPVGAREGDYLCWLQGRHPGVPISVEQSVAGLHGIEHLYDYLSTVRPPARRLSERVGRARVEGQGIGALVMPEAVAGDPFCTELVRLLGVILGQFLRSMALVTLSQGGSIWLAGSVLQSPGLAELLVADGCLLEAFRGGGAQHADLMEQIPMFLILDHEIAVKGALALSKALAA